MAYKVVHEKMEYGVMMLTIHVNCNDCNKLFILKAREEDWLSWNNPNGPLIQNAFPYWSDDQRELLLSGICGTCFENLFRDEE